MEEFIIGDKVYHRSNANIVMIVIAIDGNNITCRWVEEDKKSKRNETRKEVFLKAELTENYDDASGAFVIASDTQ
jgi:hypothetical protein